jgi:hypothetical protein
MTLVDMSEPDYGDQLYKFLDIFLKLFGEEKFLKIYNKIQESNKISDLIRVSHQKNIAPNKNDFLYSLKEVPYFIFSDNNTHTLGAILAHNRWNEECNKYLHLADNNMLNDVLLGIMGEYFNN